MSWEIVLGIIALCGAGVTLGGVLAKLIHTLTRLDVTLTALDKTVGEDKSANEREHSAIHNKLDDHEGRIKHIEFKEGILK